MGIGISVIDVRLNATGKEIPHKPTGNRIKDQLAQSTHEPTAIVRLSVVDHGIRFEFTHEAHPLTSLDAAVESAKTALLPFSVELQKAVEAAKLLP
jgi:hypothetical protein